MSSTNSQSSYITLEVLKQLKSLNKTMKLADSTGAKLSSKDTLVRTLALRRFLVREVLGSEQDEPRVGVFLPPTVREWLPILP